MRDGGGRGEGPIRKGFVRIFYDRGPMQINAVLLLGRIYVLNTTYIARILSILIYL